MPTIINGQILPGDVDRYRFHATKGQHLVVDVSARRLIPYLSDAVPGWFQAAITLRDAVGRELAYDDDFRFHPDPVFHVEIPEDGEYVIEIKDALYRGREDFVYRLAVGELPFVTSIFPLGGRAGTRTKVELHGWNLSQTNLTQMARRPGLQDVFIREGRLYSNRLPFSVDTIRDGLEEEPNNEPSNAHRVKYPSIIDGRVDRPGDVDIFGISCRAGMELVAEVKARRLDSSLDSVLKLTDAAGTQIAFNDDDEDRAAGLTTHHADSRLSVTIPKHGLYYLHLADAQQRGGVDYGYRLHIDAAAPDFELRVVPSSINARAGTTVTVTIHAFRRDGFSDAITLKLKDSTTGIHI